MGAVCSCCRKQDSLEDPLVSPSGSAGSGDTKDGSIAGGTLGAGTERGSAGHLSIEHIDGNAGSGSSGAAGRQDGDAAAGGSVPGAATAGGGGSSGAGSGGGIRGLFAFDDEDSDDDGSAAAAARSAGMEGQISRSFSGENILRLDLGSDYAMKGFLSKRGHIRHNWKRRYFVLHDGVLSYYEKPLTHPPYGENFKGSIPLKGAYLERDTVGNTDQLHVVGAAGQKDLLVEAPSKTELREWYKKLKDAIRAENVKSIQEDEDVPDEVMLWYHEQRKRHKSGMAILSKGHLFYSHVLDTEGSTCSWSPCWVTLAPDQDGLLWQNVDANRNSASAIRHQSRGAGHRVLFTDIDEIVLGSDAMPEAPNPQLGDKSSFFSIITGSRARSLNLEVETEQQRNRWLSSLRDILQYERLPKPPKRAT